MKSDSKVSSHPAQVNLITEGKGGFTGMISHVEFGDSQINEGRRDGEEFTGKVVLGGHTEDFEAKLSGASITGRVSLN